MCATPVPASDKTPIKGDLLATLDDPAEVIAVVGRFLQHYRENANWLERTYAWVPRCGIEKIRAVVVEDSEGIAERLDAEAERIAPLLVDLASRELSGHPPH